MAERPGGRHLRPAVAGAVALALLGACTRASAPPPTSLVPLVPPQAFPVPTAATTTTVVRSSMPDEPLLAALPDGECVFAPLPPDAAEITFVAGERLMASTPDGSTVSCVAEIRREQRGTVQWAPDGSRALLAAATVLDADGTRGSGFDTGSPRVRWELPDGAGLISPSSSGNSLVRREATSASSRTELTFLERTWAAAPHPFGWGTVVAAGRARDGQRGIFAGPEPDQPPRLLLNLVDPEETITELAVDAAGDTVYFVTDNGAQFRVHQLAVATLTLGQLEVAQAPVSALTGGAAWRSVAWRVGLCNSITQVRYRDDRTGRALTVGPGTPLEGLALSPVGWLDSGRLVVAARTLGCDGPADVWVWDLLNGSATLLVKSVEFPAVRVRGEPAGPLAVDPTAVPAQL